MDVRIGVTQVARELLVELADDTDRDALEGADRRGAWPTTRRRCGSPTGGAARSRVPVGEDRLRRGRRGRRRPPDRLRRLTAAVGGGVRPTCSIAACSSSPARAASARPRSSAALGHARRSPRASARLVCEVDAKGRWPRPSRPARCASRPARSHAGLSAMAMNTEDSLREYLAPPLRMPLVARLGPLARTLRLRGRRRARA